MDEDELAEARRHTLQATGQYDTFGSTAAELARRGAVQDAVSRPSAAFGPLPDEFIAPVADSIGEACVPIPSMRGFDSSRLFVKAVSKLSPLLLLCLHSSQGGPRPTSHVGGVSRARGGTAESACYLVVVVVVIGAY